VNVEDLKPAPYNPRKISDPKMKMLGKAMKEFGDLSGIIYNIRSNRTVGGHQRVKHLDPSWLIVKEDFTDDVGTVALGYIETPYGRWTYREVDWNEQREIAANIAANKHGGEFDFPMLKDLIVQIDDGALDLELTGFDGKDFDKTFGGGAEKIKGFDVGQIQYAIIVECSDEKEQTELLTKLEREGMKCRLLML
jgi:hypothetical protein